MTDKRNRLIIHNLSFIIILMTMQRYYNSCIYYFVNYKNKKEMNKLLLFCNKK